MRKYIIIPEYVPLYAMQKCYGPTHGPLTQPCPTPVDIIGQLLKQTGTNKMTIYEVIKETNGFSTPVHLTLENYRLPYAEIAGLDVNTKPADVIIEDTKPSEPKVFLPEVEADKESAVDKVDTEDVGGDMQTPVDQDNTNMNSTEVEQQKPIVNPYAGMTKAERREAKRKAAEEAAAAEAAKLTESE